MPLTLRCPPDAPQPIPFAAGELTRYLTRMLPWDPPMEAVLEAAGEGLSDGFTVTWGPGGGHLRGSNPRSVLLAVYALLRRLGCRFLGPGAANEVVPVLDRVPTLTFAESAAFRHRGVCIEGADSEENVLDFVDWLPKVGYNSFFLQFKSPYAFLKRWYHHENNPRVPPLPYTPADAEAAMGRIQAQVKRRGLLLHKGGHGWTGEALGYPALDWDADPAPPAEDKRTLCAQVNGVRGLWKGVPANTNLCLSDPRAVEALCRQAADYAQAQPEMDYLHLWLADEYNNVCECDACRATTLSDQYVALLERIDRELTRRGLDTKVVFLLYQELLWPPIRERLTHPQRFLLMFAPISRTFERSYDLEGRSEAPAYIRNRVVLPTDLGENLALLRGWQRVFPGQGFVYDYPLGRAHYGDLGYLHIARVIRGDAARLRDMGMEGYISCQELRAGCPNYLPNYVLGRALWDERTDLEQVTEEYFRAAYGAEWERALRFLTALSDRDCCDYLNGKGPRRDGAMARRLEEALAVCRDFDDRGEGPMWPLLRYHRGYALRLLTALRLLAAGEEGLPEAVGELRDYICENEPRFQRELDVYRILEVTGRYTGFPHPDMEGDHP